MCGKSDIFYNANRLCFSRVDLIVCLSVSRITNIVTNRFTFITEVCFGPRNKSIEGAAYLDMSIMKIYFKRSYIAY